MSRRAYTPRYHCRQKPSSRSGGNHNGDLPGTAKENVLGRFAYLLSLPLAAAGDPVPEDTTLPPDRRHCDPHGDSPRSKWRPRSTPFRSQRADREHAELNLSEYLGGIPGLVARDRQNYAQDEQISIRGFGARSTFGVRGVRLYVDGIPATMPDGQGQVSNFDLGSADRIEVLRGPFSALYGNSSGGVIQIFTADGTEPAELRSAASAAAATARTASPSTRAAATRRSTTT